MLDESLATCNSTVLIGGNRPAVYIHTMITWPVTSSTITTTAAAVTNQASPPACTRKFSTNPGQRIDITLLSFTHYQAYEGGPTLGSDDSQISATLTGKTSPYKAECPLAAQIIENGVSNVIGLCTPRHREQQAYLTNSSSVSLQVVGDLKYTAGSIVWAGKVANYLLKLEGNNNIII